MKNSVNNNLNFPKKKKPWDVSDYELVLMASLSLLFLFVFAYLPMYGVTLAFKDGDGEINVLRSLFADNWVGFYNFKQFFADDKFYTVISNTLSINLLMLCIEFPAPIIFALLLNEIQHTRYKKTVQTISTFPHFLSWTIFGGIILALTNVNTGVTTPIFEFLKLADQTNKINLVTSDYIWVLLIISSLIKSVGWGSIIYLAAITGINPEIYEAATLDGAGRFQRMRYITLPSISATITVFFILRISNMLDNSFEMFYIFQNGVNLSKSEVLTTYIWKVSIGSQQMRYSYASALGLFNSIIGLILLLLGNFVSKKITGKGIY